MTELVLPKIDKSVIKRKDYIVQSLQKITNAKNVLSHIDEIKTY